VGERGQKDGEITKELRIKKLEKLDATSLLYKKAKGSTLEGATKMGKKELKERGKRKG